MVNLYIVRPMKYENFIKTESKYSYDSDAASNFATVRYREFEIFISTGLVHLVVNFMITNLHRFEK